MADIFNIVPGRKPGKTAFNLSHEWKSTLKFGVLTPCLCREVLPSDVWKFSTESFTRFAPLVAPIMHRVNTFQHYFFVPNRIIMKDWEAFISPQGVPDEERPIKPQFIIDHFPTSWTDSEQGNCATLLLATSTLLDYLGVNIQHLTSYDINGLNIGFDLLPFLAYQHIWLEYYADENIYHIREIKKQLLDVSANGVVRLSEFQNYNEFVGFYELVFQLHNRAFEKDYFTSMLPDTQRGAEVTLGSMSLNSSDIAQHLTGQTDIDILRQEPASASVREKAIATSANFVQGESGAYGYKLNAVNADGSVSKSSQVLNGKTNIFGDDESIDVNPVTVNELRRAVKLQEFLEKSMRGGYRLIEQIKAHFGVISSDARLDRPQFLGGDMQKVIVSEVSSTADTSNATLGEYSGHGTEIGNTKRRKFFSEEHGWIICIFSCLPRTAYSQGIDRQLTRFDWLDYAWPEFAHLGEQEVKGQELYATATSGYNELTIGYQSRYAEYKTIPSQIHGEFKTNLSYWTMTRQFHTEPFYGDGFVECSPTDNAIMGAFSTQIADGGYLFTNMYHKITCSRPLPKFGVPML